MKPQNKFQQVVVETSKKIPPITKEQIQWGYQNCIEHIGQRTAKGKITCTECNHVFTGGEWEQECPSCKTKLKVQTTNKRIFKGCEYLCFITTCGGYQVIRYLMIKCTAKVGSYPEYSHAEVMQRWIAPDGRYCTFAKLRQTMGTMYYDSWIFSTPLELRSEVDAYDRLFPYYYYPKQQLIPELKRTGIRKRHFNQRPFDVYRALLKDSRMETLLKSGQTHLFKSFLSDTSRKLDIYWASIRICVRNGFQIKDATLWFDYIDYLRMFGKDLHNAKYVCPADLHKEHDRYMQKKAKADAQLALEKQLEKEADYREAKARFFGVMFSNGRISVHVLESVQEIIAEGIAMKHCVSSYHSKEDSLILSACIDGNRIETVEISLSQLKIVQCRGKCNKYTKYHNQIVQLVEKNLPLIEQRLAA
jgi:hypothetical protein